MLKGLEFEAAEIARLRANVLRQLLLDDPAALAALMQHSYDGFVAVEPFVQKPGGPASAARAIGYLRGIEEALAWAR